MSLRFIPAPPEPALANSAFLAFSHPLRLASSPSAYSVIPLPNFRNLVSSILVFRLSRREWFPESIPFSENVAPWAPTSFILIEFCSQCGFSVFPESLVKPV